MSTARRSARELHWQAVGSGADVVLLPGLGSGARLFGTLPRRFARAGLRCTTYDPVGVAPSSPLPDGDYRFDDAAEDVWSVADAAGVTRTALVGTSLGGKVALTAAALRPERVACLVLLASSAHVTPRARRVYRFFERVASALEPEALADALAPFLFGRSFHARHPDVVDDIVRATRPDPRTRALMVAQARALLTFDGTALAEAVRCPTLLVAGGEDTLTGVDEVAATAERIAGSTFLQIPGAGHSLLLEDPAVFDAVRDFVQGAG